MPEKETKIRSLRPIKLKDKRGRNRLVLNLKDIFSFEPEIIIIDKVHGQTSTIIISAVVPEKVVKEDKKKEEKEIARKMDKLEKLISDREEKK